MNALSKYAVKLAVLQFPEAFGLRDEDVNPILAYTLVMAESAEDIIDHESILEDFLVECSQTVDSKVALILTGRAEMPDIKGNQSKGNGSAGETRPAKPSNGKTSSKDKGGKLSNKQLRYIGYLKHQLGQNPDYDQISGLSAKAATMLIKDLEKELKNR